MTKIKNYITSNPRLRYFIPHSGQNIIIREYTHKLGIPFNLPMTEVSLAAHYPVLKDILSDVDIEVVVFYSLEMLPWEDENLLKEILHRISNGLTIHFALENLAITKQNMDELSVIKKYDRERHE